MQWELFPAHPEIIYVGSDTKGARIDPGGCISKTIESINSGQGWGSGEKYTEEFNRALNGISDSGKVIVISDEALGTSFLSDNEVKVLRLRQVVGRAKVIVVFREPVSWIRSRYLQWLKGYGEKHTDFQNFEQWVTGDEGRQYLPELDYLDIVRRYEAAFGYENVGVFIFEEMVQDPHRFVEKICGFMEISAEPVRDVFLNRHRNPTIDSHALLVKKIRSYVGPLANMMLLPGIKPVLKAMGSQWMPKRPVQVSLSPEMANNIRTHCKFQCRGLAEARALPLNDYGYPI